MISLSDRYEHIKRYYGVHGDAYLHSPTGNCQLFFVSCFSSMPYLSGQNDDEIRETIKEASIIFDKPLFLIDVWNSVIGHVERIFSDKIILKSPYDSTNGSKMCIFIIKA